jgi:hypothetical protein
MPTQSAPASFSFSAFSDRGRRSGNVEIRGAYFQIFLIFPEVALVFRRHFRGGIVSWSWTLPAPFPSQQGALESPNSIDLFVRQTGGHTFFFSTPEGIPNCSRPN